MMKVLKKKRMGGFTLIELIVVIAILGILAAIAIPRFSGFTNKAKVGADDQYIALFQNAVTVLLAESKITAVAGSGGATVTLSNGADGNTPTVAVAGLTGVTNTDFTNLVTAKKMQFFTNVVITVTNTDGTTTVAYTPARP